MCLFEHSVNARQQMRHNVLLLSACLGADNLFSLGLNMYTAKPDIISVASGAHTHTLFCRI